MRLKYLFLFYIYLKLTKNTYVVDFVNKKDNTCYSFVQVFIPACFAYFSFIRDSNEFHMEHSRNIREVLISANFILHYERGEIS